MNLHADFQNNFALQLKPGDYFVYGLNGLCVVTGYSEKSYAGSMYPFLEAARVTKRADMLSIAQSQLAKSDIIRPPASLDEIRQALDIMQEPVKPDNRIYRYKEGDYREALKSGDILLISDVVRQIIGSARGKSYKRRIGAYETPESVVMNSTDRDIMTMAYDSLVAQMSFRCGLKRSDALALIHAAALKQKGFDASGLRDAAGDRAGLDDAEFRQTFGKSRKEAASSTIDRNIIPFVPTVKKEPPSLKAARRGSDNPARSNILSAVKSPAKKPPALKREPRAKAARAGEAHWRSALHKVPAAMQAHYKALRDLLPQNNPNIKAVFNLAGQSLGDPVDFQLASYAWFVRKEHRKSLSDLSAIAGQPEADIADRMADIKNTLHQSAQQKNLVAFNRVSLRPPQSAAAAPAPVDAPQEEAPSSLADKAAAQKHRRPDNAAMDIHASSCLLTGGEMYFHVSFPQELLTQTDGFSLDVCIDRETGNLVVTGTAKNRTDRGAAESFSRLIVPVLR